MPYIKSEQKKKFKNLKKLVAETPGELNFLITSLLKNYTDKWGVNYQTINDVLGSLTGAQQEYYRRVAESYENTKIKSNGDVY